MIRLAVALALAGALVAPAAAQQVSPPQQSADTVLTPEQRAMERLRLLGGVAQPDSLRPTVDTVRTQRVQVAGARGGGTLPARIQRDSIMDLLLGVPDYVATQYQGDTANFHARTNRLELRGRPQVEREGSQLAADSLIVYDELLARVCGYGTPVLQTPGMANPLVSEGVCYDTERQVAFAQNAETTVAEGATWHLRGNVYFQGDDFYSHRAIFTDCDLPWPHYHYHFGAERVKVVRDNILVARDVTLSFADVPVFWLPFMVQSLSQGRRSGILMPRFGINDIARTSARYSRRIEDVGVYWAVNDYIGTELAMDWFADNWTAVRGSLDYNFADRFLRGGLTYRQFWRQEGGREFTLSSQNSWQMDERTNLNLTANYTTSSAFVQQRSFDPRELNRSIDSNTSIRRRFDWGTMSFGATRNQQLSDNTVRWTLPSLNLNMSPITLFEALPGEERWFSNMTWQAINSQVRITRLDVDDANLNPRVQGRRTLESDAATGLTLGRLGLSQNVRFSEQTLHERQVPGDSVVVLPGSNDQRGQWNTRLNFQQRLIGTSTFTPGLALAGQFARNDETGEAFLHAPTRLDFNAALQGDLYGFWGGIGAFDRFRHRLSPSISYGYSPEARADSLQRAVFRSTPALEQNRISIGLSQTIEARYRGGVVSDGSGGPGAARPAGAVVDAAADTIHEKMPGAPAGADAATGSDGPRRRERAQTITLLSINTDALVYDFVRAREGDGIVTTQISNSVQSDLMRGLQLSFTHDLFRQPAVAPFQPVPDTISPVSPGINAASREFAPHLSRVNASFSLSGDSWLFRVLGLGRGSGQGPDARAGTPLQDMEPNVGGPAVDMTRSEFGMVGTNRRTQIGQQRMGAAGAWNASMNYTLFRPRDQLPGQDRDNQMLTGQFMFQPTENWSVNWRTGYAIGGTGFTDHVLTLSRRLHDWDANFDFVRAQNGNFSFQFRVHLRANPDIKLDYSQTDAPGIRSQQGIR
jgi:hypothetical protein